MQLEALRSCIRGADQSAPENLIAGRALSEDTLEKARKSAKDLGTGRIQDVAQEFQNCLCSFSNKDYFKSSSALTLREFENLYAKQLRLCAADTADQQIIAELFQQIEIHQEQQPPRQDAVQAPTHTEEQRKEGSPAESQKTE